MISTRWFWKTFYLVIFNCIDCPLTVIYTTENINFSIAKASRILLCCFEWRLRKNDMFIDIILFLTWQLLFFCFLLPLYGFVWLEIIPSPNENCVIWEIEMKLQIRVLNFAEQKMKFFIKDLFSKCDQIRRKLGSWLHLLKKSLMRNFIFCAVPCFWGLVKSISDISYWYRDELCKRNQHTNRTYYFFNDLISIKNLDPNNIKIDERYYRKIFFTAMVM